MWPFRRKVHQIVLYGKPGCHLCDDARSLIERLAGSAPLQLREVDITSSRELFRRYDVVIPVVVVDGLIEIQAPITERALRDALRRAPGTPRRESIEEGGRPSVVATQDGRHATESPSKDADR